MTHNVSLDSKCLDPNNQQKSFKRATVTKMSGRIPEICVDFLGLFCKSKCFQSTFWIVVSRGGVWTTPLSRGGLGVIYVQSSFGRRIHVKICWFKSNASVIHVDFSAESCPYHTRQSRISYRKFHEVHEHKGNILINFIFYISLIQIATESSVTAHFGMFNLMLGIHPSVNTCNLKIVSLVDWWTRPTHLKKKRVKCKESLMKCRQLSCSGVCRTPFSAPKISEMQKCK